MAAFQIYLQSGKQKKSRRGSNKAIMVDGGTTVMMFLVKNSLVKKEV
jgi:hypothetical protein